MGTRSFTRLALATGAALSALALGNPVHVRVQKPAFRSGIDMVPLTVTVTDTAGKYVSGMNSRASKSSDMSHSGREATAPSGASWSAYRHRQTPAYERAAGTTQVEAHDRSTLSRSRRTLGNIDARAAG
jgi:hypothetical protein